MGEVAVIDPRPSLAVGGKVAAIIPQTMDEAYRLANAVCQAGMAPRGMETPAKAMIAIMRGMEVGLTPFQALDKIAVVNGRPTIWGDGAMALVRGSGVCEWVDEHIDGEGDARVAVCEAKRRGDPKPTRRTFSVADAKKAGLWNKQGPWQQFPERMLQMRARAFCLRDLFADVLGGLYLKEEIEDAPAEARRVAPPAPVADAPRIAPAVPESASSPPAEVSDAAPEAPAEAEQPPATAGAEGGQHHKRRPPSPGPQTPAAAPPPAGKPPTYAENPGAWFKRFETRAAAAKDIDDLAELWTSTVDALGDAIDPADYEDCSRIYRREEERLAP